MDNFDIIGTSIIFILGSIFGAAAVFYTLKDKLQQQQQAMSIRRIGLLEQVAQHVGKVSHVFSKYASLVAEIGPKVERMSAKQERELESLSEELVAVYEEISIAESKLLLLGEQKLEKAMKLYTAKMAQFRKQVYPGRYNKVDDARQLKTEVSQMREQFYDVLSQRYDQKSGS
ncbi:MAG: hypothetical protein GY712_13435 [Oceanicoccus sp.]|uniref:hypothetical protein n=1 Tax=Oceanicoccus sp. TaxID=2691044 RepID=UPI0026364DFA|nr:hypothetical protein [Oceanicoccus sp.]MCP3909007.1 hypothetical protein [Oceanicoccus sp.]MDG1771971.1 hypothetical protein [Oceanicoccus sp.]